MRCSQNSQASLQNPSSHIYFGIWSLGFSQWLLPFFWTFPSQPQTLPGLFLLMETSHCAPAPVAMICGWMVKFPSGNSGITAMNYPNEQNPLREPLDDQCPPWNVGNQDKPAPKQSQPCTWEKIIGIFPIGNHWDLPTWSCSTLLLSCQVFLQDIGGKKGICDLQISLLCPGFSCSLPNPSQHHRESPRKDKDPGGIPGGNFSQAEEKGGWSTRRKSWELLHFHPCREPGPALPLGTAWMEQEWGDQPAGKRNVGASWMAQK